MRSTAERRQMILQVLCERRSELAENLALEFDVSIRTIYYDIEFSCIFSRVREQYDIYL